jgi:drug/metabolite transporter (DMT)-like permease
VNSQTRVLVLTSLAMFAFAGNSLLCRMALKGTAIDPATFTSIRVLSGALALWLIVSMRTGTRVQGGTWPSALALFAYAAAFSFAYIDLPAGTGALLLFGAVQATMILFGLWKGERLNTWQGIGLAYSLRGKGAGDPLAATAGNFLRAVAFAAALSLALQATARVDAEGIAYAIASGAITSGVGYAIWYAALRGLKAASAATVQLSVPVIAAIGGVLLLGEPLTLRLIGASVAVLGGIALVVLRPKSVG